MLSAEEALDPTVSTRSKPGYDFSGSGNKWSSGATPERRAKGFRMGIIVLLFKQQLDVKEGREGNGRLGGAGGSKEWHQLRAHRGDAHLTTKISDGGENEVCAGRRT